MEKSVAVKKNRTSKAVIISIILVLISSFYIFEFHKQLTLENIKEHLLFLRNYKEANPFLFTTLFVFVYTMIAALSIPGTFFLTLLSGPVFGVITGAFLSTLSSTLGAGIAFLLSRYLFRKNVIHKFHDQFCKYDRKFRSDGVRYLFALRVVPISPYVVVNVVMGLTSVKLWTFLWVTFTGMFPGTLVYVFAARKISDIESPSEILSWPILLLLTFLGLTPFFFHHRSKD